MDQVNTNLLRVAEIAAKLGYSEQYIRRLVYLNKIPYNKLSRKALRFDPQEIERWIIERNFQTRQAENSSTATDRRAGPADRREPAAVNE